MYLLIYVFTLISHQRLGRCYQEGGNNNFLFINPYPSGQHVNDTLVFDFSSVMALAKDKFVAFQRLRIGLYGYWAARTHDTHGFFAKFFNRKFDAI